MDLPARSTRLRPAMGDQPESKLERAISDPGSGAPTDRVDGVPAYRVQLPVFEGPLDLLLHLIQQHELDIFDIPIAFITQKYVEYVTLMHDLNIDVASEYLVMAATLTHIKSKMLLPPSPEDEEEEEDIELDPRAELVRRLLEYQKYKLAAEQLGERSILGRDVFTRGAPAPSVDGPAPLAPVGLFKLLDAFQAVLKRVKQTADHQIDVDRFSISDRINELSDILRNRRRVDFEELFSKDQTRGDLIVTFLALLEMTRIRLIRLMQSGPLEPISIELAVSDDTTEEAFEASGSAEFYASDAQTDDLATHEPAGDSFASRRETDSSDLEGELDSRDPDLGDEPDSSDLGDEPDSSDPGDELDSSDLDLGDEPDSSDLGEELDSRVPPETLAHAQSEGDEEADAAADATEAGRTPERDAEPEGETETN